MSVRPPHRERLQLSSYVQFFFTIKRGFREKLWLLGGGGSLYIPCYSLLEFDGGHNRRVEREVERFHEEGYCTEFAGGEIEEDAARLKQKRDSWKAEDRGDAICGSIHGQFFRVLLFLVKRRVDCPRRFWWFTSVFSARTCFLLQRRAVSAFRISSFGSAGGSTFDLWYRGCRRGVCFI